METENGSINTISLIMEVEEIAPEDAPSDSDSTEYAILRSSNAKDSNKNVPEITEMACSIKESINKAEGKGKRCLDKPRALGVIHTLDKNKPSKEVTSHSTIPGWDTTTTGRDTRATASSVDEVTKRRAALLEAKLIASDSGETHNSGSLEEKLSAMFQEDQNEISKPCSNSENKSEPTLEEQLTEIFQDKNEDDEMPANITDVVNSPVEENLIAIFEEEDSGKYLGNQACVSEAKSYRKEHNRTADISTSKSCAVFVESNASSVSKSLSDKTTSLKRKNTEREMHHLNLIKDMKEARVVLKKLKFPSSNNPDRTFNEPSNRDLKKITVHKPVDKNSSLSQNSVLKLSHEKQNEVSSNVSTFRKSASKISPEPSASKTKDKIAGKIIETLYKQEIKKKKSARTINRSPAGTSNLEKLNPVKPLEAIQKYEITKYKTSESPKIPAKEQSQPETVKRKRGRPPLNRNRELISSPKGDKRKPLKAPVRTQDTPLVSRVSERLQIKLMKTRAVRKKKIRGDKPGGNGNLQKLPQKSEHILRLHRTAISLAKKRKSTNFSTYGLARKRRLLNAVKTASTNRKQSSEHPVDLKQMTIKRKDSAFKQDNINCLPKAMVALTPVSLKRNGNILKSKLNIENNDAEMDKKNSSVKTSHLKANTNMSDSEAGEKNTQKKLDHKISKVEPVVKRLMVTRSKGELVRKPLQQQKKGVSLLKPIHTVNITNTKKIASTVKNGNTSIDTRKKQKESTASGLEVRNNKGIMEFLVENTTDSTVNEMEDRGIEKAEVPGITLHATQNQPMVETPSGMTDAQKMVEMRKAIWNLETRIDRYKLRQQAEERMVVYLSNKLHFYESNKYVQALTRMLKDAAPGPQQNQDAVFITDLLLGYCPESDDYEKES